MTTCKSYVFEVIQIYVMRCVIWYQSTFGICMIVQMYANAFFYLSVISICLYELAWHSNGSIKSQRLEYQSNRLQV